MQYFVKVKMFTVVWIMCGMWVLTQGSVATAGTTFEHVGANDPTIEGWSFIHAGSVLTVGPVFNDLGLGIDAWSVNNPSGSAGGTYDVFLTPSQDSEARTRGWRYSVMLRIVNTPEALDDGIHVTYVTGFQQFPDARKRQYSSGIPTCLFVNRHANMWLS